MITTPSMLRTALEEYVLTQPWWKRYANTVTAAWTGLLMIGWLVVSTWADAPEWVMYAVGGLLYIGQVLGINKTRNGVTPAVVEKVTEAVEVSYGRHAARPPQT